MAEEEPYVESSPAVGGVAGAGEPYPAEEGASNNSPLTGGSGATGGLAQEGGDEPYVDEEQQKVIEELFAEEEGPYAEGEGSVDAHGGQGSLSSDGGHDDDGPYAEDDDDDDHDDDDHDGGDRRDPYDDDDDHDDDPYAEDEEEEGYGGDVDLGAYARRKPEDD